MINTFCYLHQETRNLRNFMRGSKHRWASTTEIMDAGEDDIGDWTMSNCVKYCGCGDQLYAGYRGAVSHRQYHTT